MENRGEMPEDAGMVARKVNTAEILCSTQIQKGFISKYVLEQMYMFLCWKQPSHQEGKEGQVGYAQASF